MTPDRNARAGGESQAAWAFAVKAGQIWSPPHGSRTLPRRVTWTGADRCYGNAVRWHNDVADASFTGGSTMQFKAFVAWVRKSGATCNG